MSESKEHPIILVLDGPFKGQLWAMVKDEMILGRDETCDVTLPERPISRQHARVFKDDNKYFITNLESKNGTWVNDQKLEGTRELEDGDTIKFALVATVQFLGSTSTAPLPFAVGAHETAVPLNGRLRLDREGRRVFINSAELTPPLSLPQYRLLELLYNNTGRICTRDNVVETVWPDVIGEGVSEQAIDALVRRLRDRIAELDPDQQYIVTVRGHGFRLDNPEIGT